MANNIFHIFTFVAGAALSFTAIKGSSAQAATITYDFTTNLTSGYLSALLSELGLPDNQTPVTGYFSFDNSTLTGRGLETITRKEKLVAVIRTNYGGERGAFELEREDINIPFVTLNNGELVGLTALFINTESFPVNNYEFFTITNQEVVDNFTLRFGPLKSISGTVSGNVQYSLREGSEKPISVPEPATALGTSLFGLACLATHKKKPGNFCKHLKYLRFKLN